jgi:hypothetical protein
MTEYRAGIVEVADNVESRFRLCLPPEHRVVGSRPGVLSGQRMTEWLLEGSTLPVVASGAQPQIVTIEMTVSWDPNGAHHLDARWRHQADGEGWHVGDWPDYQSFEAAFLCR